MTKRKTVKGKKKDEIALDIEALKKIPGIHVMELGDFASMGPQSLHEFLHQHLGEAVAAGKHRVTREDVITKLDETMSKVVKSGRDELPNFGLVALHYGEGDRGVYAVNITDMDGPGVATMLVNLVSALFDRLPTHDRLSLLFDLCGRENILSEEDQETWDEDNTDRDDDRPG